MDDSATVTELVNSVSAFSDWPASFLILSAGGLIIELLATKRASEKGFQQLYKHPIYLSRAFAIFVFAFGLVCAAVIPSLPFKSILAPMALWSLSLMLLVSASFYTKGSFDQSRYWLIPEAIDKYVSPFRIQLVKEVLTSSKEKIKAPELTIAVQELLKKRIPSIGPLAWVGSKVLIESSFQQYDIERTLSSLVENGKCTEKRGVYSIKAPNE